MNGAKVFIDSNVLVYLYSDTDYQKKRIAFDAINQNDCSVSLQVFNEFSNVCIRKLHKPIVEINAAISEIYAVCDCINIDLETVQEALVIHERFKYSYFDSLIITSALECKCEYLFTEDMQDRHLIDGLTIVNIFKNGEKNSA
jgi:predicted nucleic acid-binding protein